MLHWAGEVPTSHWLHMQTFDSLFPTHLPCQLKIRSETVLVENQTENQKIAGKGANFNVEERKAFLRKFLLQIFSTF